MSYGNRSNRGRDGGFDTRLVPRRYSTTGGGDSTTGGGDPTTEGGYPTTGGSDSTTEGSGSTSERRDSTPESGVPTTGGGDSTTERSDPTTGGGDPTTGGGGTTTERSDSTSERRDSTPESGVPTTGGGGTTTERSDSTTGGGESTASGAGTGRRKAGPWIALLVAGVFEVGYALSVNGSEGFTRLGWSATALVFFLGTLFFLSVALKKIDVGIGYAVWAGIGAVGAALLGPVFFDETMTLAKGFWLAVIIGGVVWLKLADSPAVRATTSRSPVGDPAR